MISVGPAMVRHWLVLLAVSSSAFIAPSSAPAGGCPDSSLLNIGDDGQTDSIVAADSRVAAEWPAHTVTTLKAAGYTHVHGCPQSALLPTLFDHHSRSCSCLYISSPDDTLLDPRVIDALSLID